MITTFKTMDFIKELISSRPIYNIQWNPSDLTEWTFRALRKLQVADTDILMSKNTTPSANRVKLPKHIIEINAVYDLNSMNKMQEVFTDEAIGELQYKTNGGYLLFNDKQEDVLIEYMALPIDDNDQPLIPDNEYYISAVEAYIRYMLSEKGYYQRKVVINEVQRLEQEWNFYLIATKSESKMMTNDRFKTIRNKYIL